MDALILTNGNGERIYPLTAFMNKTMIPIDGKPILEHVITHLKSYKIKDIVIAVGVFKEQIINHFRNGSRWGVNIIYSESDEPQGTAGELAKAREYLERKEDFLVYYGDTLTATHLIDFYDFHKKKQGTITINGIKGYPVDTGIIERDGNYQTLIFKEKTPLPILTNIPVFWCSKNIFEISENIEKGKDFSYHVIPGLLNKKEIFVYIQDDNYHYDVGTPDRQRRITEVYLNKQVGIVKVIK